MTYVLFFNPSYLPLVLTLDSVLELELRTDTRYKRVGQGTLTEVIDLGACNGCHRTAIVDALCFHEREGDCGVMDAEFFFGFDDEDEGTSHLVDWSKPLTCAAQGNLGA